TEDLLNKMTYNHHIENSINICNEHELFVSSKYLMNNFS
ncbi:flap endonuclease, partial [Mammaliicoccus fleurettii]